MKLAEIFEHLQYGELSNIGVVDRETGKLKEELMPKILSSVNLGVQDLHKRFTLKKGVIRIQLVPDRFLYKLDKIYQVGNNAPSGTYQYILNDGIVYNNDLIKIEKVTTNKKEVLGLNDGSYDTSVSTPQDNVLLVSGALMENLKPEILTIEYRKTVPNLRLCEDQLEQMCVNVDLPYTHLQALLLFVASRLHNPMGFTENTTHEGNNYAAKYGAECLTLESLNLRVDEVVINHKACGKGWP